jgi:hypothetical protein
MADPVSDVVHPTLEVTSLAQLYEQGPVDRKVRAT